MLWQNLLFLSQKSFTLSEMKNKQTEMTARGSCNFKRIPGGWKAGSKEEWFHDGLFKQNQTTGSLQNCSLKNLQMGTLTRKLTLSLGYWESINNYKYQIKHHNEDGFFHYDLQELQSKILWSLSPIFHWYTLYAQPTQLGFSLSRWQNSAVTKP
jgi:hypothetical protein